MIRNSSINRDNLGGYSAGFFDDDYKLAGARRTVDPNNPSQYLTCDSLLGGCQGAPINAADRRSSFFGFDYSPGGLPDRINESFAGPHDWLRKATGSYDGLGNSRFFSGLELAVDNVKNYALVVPAAPFEVSGLIMSEPGLAAAIYH